MLAALALGACGDLPPPDAAYRTVADGDPQRGLMLISQYQCGSCHHVPGAASQSIRTAPPLEAFGRRSYIAGIAPNGPATLQRWLQQPQALVPQATMPDLGVSPADARDIAAYLLSLS